MGGEGEKDLQTTTKKCEKTTKKWVVVDNLARGRLSADGRVRQPKKKALSVVSS